MVDSNGDLPLNIVKQTERGSKEVSDALLQWTFEEITKQNDYVSSHLQVSSKLWPSTCTYIHLHMYVESCRHKLTYHNYVPQMLKHTVYDTLMENAGRNQVLISLHMGQETCKMAKAIRDLFKDKSDGPKLLEENSPSRRELTDKSEQATVRTATYVYHIQHAYTFVTFHVVQ